MCRAWLKKTCPEAIRGGLLFGRERPYSGAGRMDDLPPDCEAGMDIVKCEKNSRARLKTGQRVLRLQDCVHKNSICLLNSSI
jgi:hypothetical protein